MPRICFPHPVKGDFNTFRGAYRTLHQPNYGWSDRMLADIVRYNVCFRDYMREHGAEALIALMCCDVPELACDESTLRHFRKWAAGVSLADYDIQCHLIDAEITVLGHTFKGLNDIRSHVGPVCRIGYEEELDFLQHDGHATSEGIYAGLFYKDYPILDCYDSGDDRTYQNYVFSRAPLTGAVMRRIYDTVPKDANTRMVHERVPEDNLPVLWYEGDGRQMLLASAK